MPTRPACAAAALLVALFLGLTLWEMSGDSLTTDERWHLPAGYAYWKTGDFRLSPEHPPLAKLLCAAPLLSMDLRMPPLPPPPPYTWHDYVAPFGSAFFRMNPAELESIVLRSRLPIVALGVLLVVTLFFWSWRLHGDPGAGLLTLALAATEPTLIAHSHYVTTDIALVAFALPAFYALWRFATAGRWTALAGAAVFMGLALASKFSALVLLPIFIALLLWRWPERLRRGAPAADAAVRLAATGGALVVMAVLVQSTYFFSTDLYLNGPAEVRGYRPPADYAAWALGSFHIGGVWWYALFAWLIKTPLPTMALIGLGAALSLRDRRVRRDALEFLLVPAAIYAGAVCAMTANLGVRYMIPVTVFLLVAAGAAFRWLAASKRGRLAGVVLGLWLVVSVGRAAPHFIAYFNETIGGPENAPAVIHDSNVDWGQDLKRLARYQKEHDIPEIVLYYWGGAHPALYGVRYRVMTGDMAAADRPPPGVYAISVNNLVDMKKSVVLGGADPRTDWLARFKPADRVGYSIYIYRF
jgi:dolichyl-phosphate-mannose-protein mannosyltransferase